MGSLLGKVCVKKGRLPLRPEKTFDAAYALGIYTKTINILSKRLKILPNSNTYTIL